MRKLKIQQPFSIYSWLKKEHQINSITHWPLIFFSENKFWHPFLKIAIVLLNLYSTFFSSIQKFIVFIFQAAAATTMQLIASTSLLNKNQLEIRSRNRKIPDPYYPSYRPYNPLGFPHRPRLPHPDFRPISNNFWKLKTYASIIIILFVDCNNKKINNKTFLCLWICRRVVYQSWIITLQCFIRSKLVTDRVPKIGIRVTEIWLVKPMGWV